MNTSPVLDTRVDWPLHQVNQNFYVDCYWLHGPSRCRNRPGRIAQLRKHIESTTTELAALAVYDAALAAGANEPLSRHERWGLTHDAPTSHP
jgi:hypothetical protein